MLFTQRLAFATALATLLLIGVGALVRATGSGLGCPDWPTCHGGVVPPGSRESLIEFSHRFTATIVGFMVIAVAILAWKHFRHIRAISWTAIAVVPLVGFQGILGAITVVRELPPAVVATHLVTAMVVLTAELVVAWGMYREVSAAKGEGGAIASRSLAIPAFVAIAWLAGVMWIGAYMAESGASTACSGWPACNGSIVPGSDSQEITHMVHRYIAGAFAVVLAPVAVAAWKQRSTLRWGTVVAPLLAVLYAAQVLVGAFNVWLTFPDALTIAHTVIAASVWFTLASAAILALYVPTGAHRDVEQLARRPLPA